MREDTSDFGSKIKDMQIQCQHPSCTEKALKSSRYCMSHDHLYDEGPAPQKMGQPKVVQDMAEVFDVEASKLRAAEGRRRMEAELRADLRAKWAFELYRDLLQRVRSSNDVHLIDLPEEIAVRDADALLNALGRLLPDGPS